MNRKKYFRIEYLVYFYILLLPIFDFVFNQYMDKSLYDLISKLSFIKLIIPLILYLYVLIKAKGKEKAQLFILTFIYIAYSSIVLFFYHKNYLSEKIFREDFVKQSLIIYNLFNFAFNSIVLYKLFYRKNVAKLRMSFNYAAAIYLISVLLFSLTSEIEPIWHYNLSMIILMLLFIVLVSLRYREDRTYSLALFVLLIGYFITTLKNKSSYYGIILVGIIYLISIIVEKHIKKQLTFTDVHKIFKEKMHSFFQTIMNLNRNRIKRLKSGEKSFAKKKIIGYSDKRIYRYNDLNRRKKYKTNKSIKTKIFDLKLKKVLIKDNYSGIDEVKSRLKQKKRKKKDAKINDILNSKITKNIFVIILLLISFSIIYIIINFIRHNIVFEFSFKDKLIYLIYFLPIVYVLFKIAYFSIFKFKNIDSEFIMLSLLVLFITFLILLNKEIIFDFSSSIIFSTILIVLINKAHLGKTYRDIEALKEQIEYKKGLKHKQRVVFGITSLSIGGVSRILVDICNGLSKKYSNLDVEIFTLFAGGEFEEGVDVKIVSLFKKPFNSYKKYTRLLISLYLKLFEPNIFNKYIRGNYETIIAFDEGDITSLFSYNDEARKIAWLHNKNYNIYSKSNKKNIGKLTHIYSRYDKIIFSREIGLRRFNKIFTHRKIRRISKDIITNYVDPLRIFIKSEIEPVYEWTDDTVTLLSVVRLYKYKALDRFIRVHKRVLNDGLEHKVYIIGDGPEMGNLKKLIRDEKLQTSVFLLGSKINPYPYIKKASYFCLFSEREEYSIVLNEAKILNKDILLTNTRTRDIVQDYPNVRIFDNSESGIYTGLRYILSNQKQDKTNFEYIYKNDEILKEIYSLLC